MQGRIRFVNNMDGYGYLEFINMGGVSEDDLECEGYFNDEKTNPDLFDDLRPGDAVGCKKLWKQKNGNIYVVLTKIIYKVPRNPRNKNYRKFHK